MFTFLQIYITCNKYVKSTRNKSHNKSEYSTPSIYKSEEEITSGNNGYAYLN